MESASEICGEFKDAFRGNRVAQVGWTADIIAIIIYIYLSL